MRYPLDELLDKRSIIQLKIERGNEKVDKDRLREEYRDYNRAVQEFVADGFCTKEQVENWHSEIYAANSKIWNLEDDIRKGKTGHLGLEEIGRTALLIRESNGIRIGIKAKIVNTTGIGYREIKINHASCEALENYKSKP